MFIVSSKSVLARKSTRTVINLVRSAIFFAVAYAFVAFFKSPFGAPDVAFAVMEGLFLFAFGTFFGYMVSYLAGVCMVYTVHAFEYYVLKYQTMDEDILCELAASDTIKKNRKYRLVEPVCETVLFAQK